MVLYRKLKHSYIPKTWKSFALNVPDERAHLKNIFPPVSFCLFLQKYGIAKHLMTSPTGNSEFCFPSTLNIPLGFILANIEGLGIHIIESRIQDCHR